MVQHHAAIETHEFRRERFDTNVVSPGKVVAELRFVFWENMLAKTHRARWINQYNRGFTNIPSTQCTFIIKRNLSLVICLNALSCRILRNLTRQMTTMRLCCMNACHRT